MKLLVENLKSIAFTDEQISEMFSQGQITYLKKGEKFIEKGQKVDKIGMLKEGLLYGWHLDISGNKNVEEFFILPEMYLVTDYQGFINNTKALITIEAIEDSILLVFDRFTMENLQKKYPNLHRLQEIDIKRHFMMSQRLVKMFQTTTKAIERVLFIQEYMPEVLARVPYTYIASFLGMHRNTFTEALKCI